MPEWIYIVGAILLFLILLLALKVNIVISYKDDLAVFLRVLFVRIKLYPEKDKKKSKQKKKKGHKKKKISSGEEQSAKSKDPSIVMIILKIKDIILDLSAKALGKLHFKFARLNIVVACEDATKTALVYGATVQSVAYLIEALNNISNVEISRFSDINVSSNFISQKSTISGKIILYIRVFGAIGILIKLAKVYLAYKSHKEKLLEDKNGKDNSK